MKNEVKKENVRIIFLNETLGYRITSAKYDVSINKYYKHYDSYEKALKSAKRRGYTIEQ